MKKKLLLAAFAFATLQINAQIANNSDAPNFTATDLNGNTHVLQNYLNQGKTVLLNISATWCGPCWNYHNTHALADFYLAYGPQGSDEAMVLYVEGDPSTPVSAIYGQGNNTHGDWTAGTPYPIIDNASIANAYQIAYYPTLFRICGSTGKTFELQQLNVNGLKNNINSNCGTLTGVPNHAKLTAGSINVCEAGIATLTSSIKNLGSNAITSATVVLKLDGQEVASTQFSGNITQFNSSNVTFNNLDVSTAGNYTVEISTINGNAIHNQEIATSTIQGLNTANESYNNIEVRVYTDNYPGEISWKIRNSNNAIVAQYGPYQAGPGSAGAGGVHGNTTLSHWFTLPEGQECYSIELSDSYGDGWTYTNNPKAGVEVYSNGELVVFVDGKVSFSNKKREAAFRTNGSLDVDSAELNSFSIYPNPTNGIINIQTSELVDVKVFDISGKMVYSQNSVNNGTSIDLSTLQSGVYLIKASSETSEVTEKIILK